MFRNGSKHVYTNALDAALNLHAILQIYTRVIITVKLKINKITIRKQAISYTINFLQEEILWELNNMV